MKHLQTLSVTLVLFLFAACNNPSDKGVAGKNDTAAALTPANTIDANKQKIEENKKIVTDFVQAFYGDKDSTAVDKYIADNVTQHNPLLKDGKDWLKNSIRPFFSNPNVQKTKIDIKQIAADGDKVWVYSRDVAPNGKAFARIEIFKIADGKIVENWLVAQPEASTSANKNGMF